MKTNVMHLDAPSIGAESNEQSLRSVMTALNDGRVLDAVDLFNEHFTFNDHALDLEFTDKERLIEFFQKSRELFPDSRMEVESTSECGDHAIAKWKLTATQTQSYGGYFKRQVRISVRGVSIAHIESERIVKWEDYYDATSSWRFSLAGLFKEWIEY